jgi:hypothetical protein
MQPNKELHLKFVLCWDRSGQVLPPSRLGPTPVPCVEIDEAECCLPCIAGVRRGGTLWFLSPASSTWSTNGHQAARPLPRSTRSRSRERPGRPPIVQHLRLPAARRGASPSCSPRTTHTQVPDSRTVELLEFTQVCLLQIARSWLMHDYC